MDAKDFAVPRNFQHGQVTGHDLTGQRQRSDRGRGLHLLLSGSAHPFVNDRIVRWLQVPMMASRARFDSCPGKVHMSSKEPDVFMAGLFQKALEEQ